MAPINIPIDRYPIRLGQFLKRAEITSDGIEAKRLITQGRIQVNDTVETRRGRQLVLGDTVTFGEQRFACS